MPCDRIETPIFLGLSHIGQVFSVGWAVKFGDCAVFDFRADALQRFKQGILTEEESNLAATFDQYRHKIEIYDEAERIRDHSLVFLTLDTPLSLEGEPNFDSVFAFLSQSKRYIGENATLIVLSQTYPGFCAHVQEKLLGDRPDIRLIYMVDTLIMGSALPRFLEPELLIFGVSRREDLPKQFNSFACKQYVFSYQEAEVVKISFNLYLLFSVSFANAMDNYCRQMNFKFAPISEALRHDARIGPKAYLSPSLGISGGHLERDLSTMIHSCRDGATRLLFEQIKNLNGRRMELLYKALEASRRERQIKTVLWVGASYKQTSFSLVNSPFTKFVNRFRARFMLKVYDSYYPVPEIEGVIPVVDLQSEIGNVDCLIFNYANPEDARLVEGALASHTPPLVFDISLRPSLNSDPGGHGRATVHRIF